MPAARSRRRPGRTAELPPGIGFGLGSGSAPLEIQPADYEAFERLLGEIQAAWSDEDVAKLHTLATPEMVSYFTKDLEENKARNDINKVSDVKLLQGDLAEAWREGETDYATRGDAVLAGRQDAGARHRPPGRRQRAPSRRPRSGPSCGRAAQLGTLGDPAGQLIVGNSDNRKAPRFIPRRLFFARASIRRRAPE